MKTRIIILLSLSASFIKAQDVIFSQVNESPIVLNPANAGAQYDLRANLNYRQQWRSIAAPFVTMAASADGKILRQSQSSSLGLGLYIMNDRAAGAQLNTFLSGLMVSGKVPLTDKQNISAGIGTTFFQRRIDFSALTWDMQFDGLQYNSNLPNGEQLSREHSSGLDLSAGLQWSYGKGATTLSSNDQLGVQIGFATFHLNKPNWGFANDDPAYWRYILHTTLSYGIKNSNMQFSPSAIVSFQGPSRMIYFGTVVKYKLQESSRYTDYVLARMINVGTFYRLGDAIVLSAQIEWDQYALGISYDINVSSLTRVSYGRGGFELSARYFPIRHSASSRLL